MRPYYSYDDSGGGTVSLSLGGRWTRTIKVLILANALAFLLVLFLDGRLGRDADGVKIVFKWLGLYRPYLVDGAVWQLVTYMFVHNGLWHLFGNMLGLYFFGGAVERHLGTRSFLVMYFLCGLAGAGLSLFQWGPPVPLVGASGGTLGVLVAFAVLEPQARIILLPIPIPIRARTLAIIYGFITVAGVIGQARDGVGHLAHLGGMAVAYAYVRLGLGVGLARVLERPFGVFRNLKGYWRNARRVSRERRSAAEQAELDRILEKVHREGITSLSNQERDFLNLMSRKYRERR